MTLKVWLLLFCSLVGYAEAEYMSKCWSLRPRWSLASIAVISYLINVVFWLPALREHKGLAVLSAIYGLAYCVVSVLIGYYGFHEAITLRQWAGIGLAITAIVLLS